MKVPAVGQPEVDLPPLQALMEQKKNLVRMDLAEKPNPRWIGLHKESLDDIFR